MTGDSDLARKVEATPAKLGPHIVVIGGGASGVLFAAHLLRQAQVSFRVTLIEAQNETGRGLAYTTDDPDHLLNTRVLNMSAYPDRPGDFLDWLQTRAEGAGITAQCFVSRVTYGSYLNKLVAAWLEGPEPRRLRVIRAAAVRVQDSARGVVVHLADGQSVIGDYAVLATGHVLERPDPEGLLQGAWGPVPPVGSEARVAIIGSGLSMVDRVLSLLKAGHRGEIVALSRRGLLPRSHTATKPLALTLADIPLGAPASVLVAWVRDQARRAERAGGTWRDAVDGIRPYIRAIWRNLPPVERGRFLRHAATWWDVHRHRIPPASDDVIQAAVARGQLRLLRGAYLGAVRAADGSPALRLRPIGSREEQTLPAAAIYDCRGIRRDPQAHASPLVADLLSRGRARIDGLRFGLDVDTSCRLIDADGSAVDRILAIGPASRAAFWEITAIPDIREQVAGLAELLAEAYAG